MATEKEKYLNRTIGTVVGDAGGLRKGLSILPLTWLEKVRRATIEPPSGSLVEEIVLATTDESARLRRGLSVLPTSWLKRMYKAACA